MNLIPLPAFQDNYLWLLHDEQRALVVDPGDAAPVQSFLAGHGLQLDAILVTHHHPDHIGGLDALRDTTGAKVYGPARERIPQPLEKLAALPGPTQVCCTHEYTLSNLEFATTVEPGNLQLEHYRQQCKLRRSRGEPTLPSTIAVERGINPFLRTGVPAVAQAAHDHDGADEADAVAVFATLRQWKNGFR
jgi:glyoxylase-like metal-dependent hydrolase (beta-lactamase superfamily II)